MTTMERYKKKVAGKPSILVKVLWKSLSVLIDNSIAPPRMTSINELALIEERFGTTAMFEYVAKWMPITTTMKMAARQANAQEWKDFYEALSEEYYMGKNPIVLMWLRNCTSAKKFLDTKETTLMHEAYQCGIGEQCENEDCECPCHDDDGDDANTYFYRDVGLR